MKIYVGEDSKGELNISFIIISLFEQNLLSIIMGLLKKSFYHAISHGQVL